MIYLHRYTNTDVDIAVCETEAGARAHEDRGFTRCDRDALMVAWKTRDDVQKMAAIAALAERPAVETAPLARAVGDAPKPPAGWVLPSHWH